MDEGVYVERVPESGRYGIPEEPLLCLVVRPVELDSERPKDAKPHEHTTDMCVDREGGPIERAHHDAGCALGADFRQSAKEVERFVVGPRTRRVESAGSKVLDQRTECELKATGLSASES